MEFVYNKKKNVEKLFIIWRIKIPKIVYYALLLLSFINISAEW